jgi:hypothetical protein
MLGIQAGRAAENTRELLRLERRRHRDNQLLNILSNNEKEKIKKIVLKFNITQWFNAVEENTFAVTSNLTKRYVRNRYLLKPTHFNIRNLNHIESFAFCYFLLPKITDFFKNKENYSIDCVLSSDDRIVLYVRGVVSFKWYERLIYCS